MKRKLAFGIGALILLQAPFSAMADETPPAPIKGVPVSPGAPTDYFSEAIANGPNTYATGAYDFVSPLPSISTGKTGEPLASVTNPQTQAYYQGVLIGEGNASATADRADGTLHASAGPTVLTNSEYTGFSANSSALFGDTLHFTNLAAGPSTETTITFGVTLDGVLGAFLPPFNGPGPEHCCMSWVNLQVEFGNAEWDGGTWNGFAPTTDHIVSTSLFTEELYGPQSVNKTFTGQMTFEGPSADAALLISMSVGGQLAYSNFGQTASFSFGAMSKDVSFTSASGDFLTGSAAPEAPAWAMLLLGFSGLSALGPLRRRLAAAALPNEAPSSRSS